MTYNSVAIKINYVIKLTLMNYENHWDFKLFIMYYKACEDYMKNDECTDFVKKFNRVIYVNNLYGINNK